MENDLLDELDEEKVDSEPQNRYHNVDKQYKMSY